MNVSAGRPSTESDALCRAVRTGHPLGGNPNWCGTQGDYTVMKAALKFFSLVYLTAILLLAGACSSLHTTTGTGTGSGGPFTIGGTVSGLAAGESVVLQDNGANNLTVNANGPFTFSTSIASGGAFAVTVLTQPSNPSQTCVVSASTGTATANVTGITITCTTNPVTAT